MCGIAGIVDFDRGTPAPALGAAASRMAATLTHRGPDDAGVWVDEAAGVALAHRRLSILDLTPEGHQPMTSADGRWVVSFNGEIYNFTALRDELAAHGDAFRGRSDTEVLLAAIARWGVEAALGRLNGMFAVALWDRDARVLHLFRDRLGEKPLYFGVFGGTLLFGSELEALRAHPAFDDRISRGALALYMRLNHVPAPHCIYEGVRKLPPGCRVEVHAASGRVEEPRPYWSLQAAWAAALDAPFRGGDAEAVDRVDALLRDAVALRMHSDVPLGAFLSGGIDSTLVVAMMQARSARRVRTFTIGFTDPTFDEAPHARAVARHLGTDHTELYVSPEDALAVIPSLPRIYDEPFADSSQVPTFLVSRLARGAVTVSLSGDGGDEAFGGYQRYARTEHLWQALRLVPAGIRSLLAGAVGALAGAGLPAEAARRLIRLASVLPARDVDSMYLDMVFPHWQVPGRGVLAPAEPPTPLSRAFAEVRGGSVAERLMLWDLLAYLPDDILVKVDRASMHVSLESRMPLLDHRVTELALSLPLRLKRRGGVTKWVLRRVLDRYVPPALVDRPKRGFQVPLDAWLRGPLGGWARDLLSPTLLSRQGYLDTAVVAAALEQHLAGARRWGPSLWVACMFQAWLAARPERDARAAPPSRVQLESPAAAPAGAH